MEEADLYPKVSIIVVAYNHLAYTKQCLASLLNNNEYPNAEIIIVDNASSDGTKQWLSEIRNPNIKVIFSTVNTGFSGGNTLGCKAATGDILILLNNDTIVPLGWISRLIRPLNENPELGMVGPVTNYAGNEQRLEHFIGDSARGADLHWLDDLYRFYNGRWRYTDFLAFFCVAMKREVYEKAGDLDADYGIGMFEDNDYCEKVKQAGYKLAIIEDAFVFHHGSVSFRQLKDEYFHSLWNQNKEHFERKWGKKWIQKPPASIFNIFEPKAIAHSMDTTNKTLILVLGEKDWPAVKGRWQHLLRTLASDHDNLIIAHLYKYYGRCINGIRKAGPSFYITNRLDLFRLTPFHLILYCGETAAYDGLLSRSIVVDGGCYAANSRKRLPPVKDAVIYQEEQIDQLAEKIMRGLR